MTDVWVTDVFTTNYLGNRHLNVRDTVFGQSKDNQQDSQREKLAMCSTLQGQHFVRV